MSFYFTAIDMCFLPTILWLTSHKIVVYSHYLRFLSPLEFFVSWLSKLYKNNLRVQRKSRLRHQFHVLVSDSLTACEIENKLRRVECMIVGPGTAHLVNCYTHREYREYLPVRVENICVSTIVLKLQVMETEEMYILGSIIIEQAINC